MNRAKRIAKMQAKQQTALNKQQKHAANEKIRNDYFAKQVKLAARNEERLQRQRRIMADKLMDQFEDAVQKIKETLQAKREPEEIWWSWTTPSPPPPPVYAASGPDIVAALLSREDG